MTVCAGQPGSVESAALNISSVVENKWNAPSSENRTVIGLKKFYLSDLIFLVIDSPALNSIMLVGGNSKLLLQAVGQEVETVIF